MFLLFRVLRTDENKAYCKVCHSRMLLAGIQFGYSNHFLLESLDTRLRGYDGIFLRFCTNVSASKFVCNLSRLYGGFMLEEARR